MTTLNPPTINVLLSGLAFPEGPAFAPDGSLWLVELKNESLIRLAGGAMTRYHVGGAPNGIAIDANGLIWFCDADQNAIRQFDPVTEQTVAVAHEVDGDTLDKPNDLAFDRLGNLVFTCPGNSRQEPTGYVCVRTPDGQVRKIADGLFFPNGLAFSLEGRRLIIAETYRHRLWKGDWDAQTADWTNVQVWATVEGPNGPGGPDGMAFDEEGNVFIAVYGTGAIHIIDPAGQVFSRINVPGRNPTNCAFDPSGQLGLVITEAEQGQLLAYQLSTNSLYYKPSTQF